MRSWDLERRIRRVWDKATPAELEAGARWYAEARTAAARLALSEGMAVVQAAGVIAALSPGNRWERNIQDAQQLVEWFFNGQGDPPHCSTYSHRNVEKAIDILKGAWPAWTRGPKVTAFFRLILTGGRSADMCVDTHAMNLAFGRRQGVRGAAYRETERRRVEVAYRRLAKKMGVWPSTLQAVTWLVWKRLGEGREK